MSAPEARLSYEMYVYANNRQKKQKKLYEIFLDWAISNNADGIIAGATFPDIIRYCNKKSYGKLDIYSPGIGVQGGKVNEVISAGTNYLIVGRTILNSKNPVDVIKKIHSQSIGK